MEPNRAAQCPHAPSLRYDPAMTTRSRVPAALALLLGCSTPPGSKPTAAAPDSGTAPTTQPDTNTPDTDTDSGDTGEDVPPEPPYCRSLDPDWRDHYVDAIDVELAEVIEEHELEGDGRVYVTEDGTCAWRDLPDITDPLPLLGRELFFSLDLSGDRDVACATCHHPELGGGDAISLSLGPGHPAHLMGADRARGLSDITAVQVARNAPTTFNMGLWDTAMFWDGRVESPDGARGANGEGSPILAEDLHGVELEEDSPATLVEAQAYQPVAALHEMGGTWGTAFDTDAELRNAIAARLALNPGWVDRFAAVCDTPGLPATWSAACDTADATALVTFPHIARALAEYQRSQTFTRSPWAAYVQGDVDAIDESAKRGALVFYRNIGDQGQGCVRCHSGDLFSDEKFHAIAGHQIGPGIEGTGDDFGRQRVTGDDSDQWKFRTPSLLNVEVTAPYFHAGSMASLTQTVVFYRNIEVGVDEYFGSIDRQELHPRPWCRMTQFQDIPGCDELYTSDHTHGGDIFSVLDEDAGDIIDFQGEVSVQLVAFLRSLTDPRVRSADDLAPWVSPDSVLEVTDTSSEWDRYCEVMVERDSIVNLRSKGFRWVTTGEVVDGLSVNAAVEWHDLFGLQYWREIVPDFEAVSCVSRTSDNLGTVLLEALTADQREVLLNAYSSITAAGHHQAVQAHREAVFTELGRLRAADTTGNDGWTAAQASAFSAEGALIAAMARAYRDTALAVPESDRTAHFRDLKALVGGDLSSLPDGVFSSSAHTVTLSAAVQAELDAIDTTGGPDLLLFAAQYATFWTGWDCQYSFMPRSDRGARRANYFGFLPWSDGYLFNLDNGKTGPGPLLAEVSGFMARHETTYGLRSVLLHADTLSIAAQHNQLLARGELATEVEAVKDLTLSETALQAHLDRIIERNEAVGALEAEQLEAELDYYVPLAQAITAAGNTDFADYLACIEDPATQAMRDHGGFEALGGGSCLP